MANIAEKYYVRRGEQQFATIASLFGGVRVLKIEGMTDVGSTKNVYTASWVGSQTEDYMVAGDNVVRENVDISITFIVSNKYGAINVRQQHDAFIAYMTDGELYIKSDYIGRVMRCVCIKDYKPTSVHIERSGNTNDYIIGTLQLHTLDNRAGDDDGYIANPYPSSGGSTPTPTPTQQVNTTNVYDAALGATQASLNQHFEEKVNNLESDLSAEATGRRQDIQTINSNILSLASDLAILEDEIDSKASQAIVNSIQAELNHLKELLAGTDDDGFNVTDSDGNIGLKYDEDGLDAALLSDHFKNLITQIEGIGLQLGETSDTAYAGNKGKKNAEDIQTIKSDILSLASDLATLEDEIDSKASQAIVTAIQAELISLKELLAETSDDGFNVTDSDGNVGLKYDEDGLDAALLSDHFKNLITQIEGIGLQLGETSDTAYAGNKGKKNAEDIQTINSNILSLASDLATLEDEIDGKASQAIVTAIQAELNRLKETFAETDDDSFNITDSDGNVGLKYDEDGLDTALLSEHFKELVKNIEGIGQDEETKKKINSLVSITYNLREVNEDGFYLVDEDGYIGAYMDSDGSYGFGGGSSYTVVKEIDYA